MNKSFQRKKILYVRLELIKDFFYSLLDKIYVSYLGDSFMQDNKHQYEHFEYCLGEILKSFKTENINFNIDDVFKKILFAKFQRFFYKVEKNQDNIDEFRHRIFIIFDYNTPKTESQNKELYEYYDLFSKSL